MKNPSPRFTSRETDTIIAALRYWQREGHHSNGHELDIASEHGAPLSDADIDELIENKINIA